MIRQSRDGFWDMFKDKQGLDDIADNPLNQIFAPWLADGAQVLAAGNECLDGGRAANCVYAIAEIAVTVSGAKALASTGKITLRTAEIIVDLGVTATDRIIQEVKEQWGSGDEIAPLPMGASTVGGVL